MICAPVSLAAQDVATHNRRGLELSAEGRHQEAITEFEKALSLAPSQPVIRRNLANTHANFAAILLQEQVFQDAVVEFQAAIELFPDESRFHMGLGVAFLGLREMHRAVEALKQARDLNPQQQEVYRLLGEAYYRQGDATEAMRIWEEGLRVHPGDQSLERLIAQAERERKVDEQYHREVGHHFTLRYVGQVREKLGREILKILERAYEEVGYDLNHYPRTEVEVILHSDADFQTLTHLPVWVGGAFDERSGRIRIPVRGITQVADVQPLLYHEYTHVLIRELTGGKVPTWFNEGLALIEQRTSMDGAVEVVRQLAVERKLPSLGALSGSFVGLSGRQASVAYAVSYAATKYFVERWSLWDAQHLLRRLGEGVPFEAALEEVTRLTLPDFEREWRESLFRGY